MDGDICGGMEGVRKKGRKEGREGGRDGGDEEGIMSDGEIEMVDTGLWVGSE
ncbi:predicted protein [Sclerotinia sclerotiorum 1980 UF-70]|uniref:Uncharacterized protein n=1 Tax=Sclerotinia sclerotiorum (strain ATCC 18683 / 1980 / Ss-1) TaxID=665079 RepID=A7EYR0_SCLS1|nr:predicted protein [Sclerotinia sclerotiorum 1980 UF-70]EDN94602.1 predicted protein [Sclerotinia sclerotiorum 1980 UF-70]